MKTEMQLRALLNQVWANGCQLRVDQNMLKLSGNTKLLDQAVLGQISQNKTDIIELLCNASEHLELSQSRPADLPLSSSQSSLWFAHKISDLGQAYSMPTVMMFDTLLDKIRLRTAFEQIVAKYEIFRTSFSERDGSVYQNIAPYGEVAFYSELLLSDGQTQVSEAALLPFDLTRGPLIRLHCFQNEQKTLLVLNIHHIISDGVSINLLLNELTRCYEGKTLEEVTYHYADFAVAQQRWLKHPATNKALCFWSESLEGTPDCISLPLQRVRSEIKSSNGARIEFFLDEGLSKQLENSAYEYLSTKFVTSLAAFFVLLHKISGQDDVCVGVPFANRGHDSLESMQGFFVNTLPIRSQMRDIQKFSQLVHRLQENMYEIYEWQSIPLDQIITSSKLTRSNSFSPLFQVMFAYQNQGQHPIIFDGIKARIMDVELKQAKYDLTLTLIESERGIRAVLEYNSDLLAVETVQSFADYYKQIVSVIDSNPELDNLSLRLSEHEMGESFQYPSIEKSDLLSYIATTAERNPDAIAVLGDGVSLTYRELMWQVNARMRKLGEVGIRQGTSVGVFLDSCIEQIAEILAVLGLGAAYVPLSKQYPQDRLSFMEQDAGLSHIIHDDPELAVRLFERAHLCQSLALDELTESFTVEPDMPDINIVAEMPAYIIYTSGSSGRPKGVVIHHGAAINHMLWMIDEFNISSKDKILQKTPLSFDASVWEIFVPLMAGATLVVADKDSYRNVEKVIKDISHFGITIVQMVPSVIDHFLDEMVDANTLSSLRVMFSGGETLPVEICRRISQSLPVIELVNLYGPSEATIDATFWRVPKPYQDQSVKIGKPIRGMSALVMGENNQFLAHGEVGELVLFGEGISQGYLNRPELTLSCFITSPHGKQERWYKTGDLVRQHANGEFEFLGRLDNQIKLRGCRIEIEEIESVIRSLNTIDDVTVGIEQLAGEPQLFALYSGVQQSSAQLRDATMALLPNYMVPLRYLHLKELPRLPNGKLDRKKALRLVSEMQQAVTEYSVPENPLETWICQLFAGMLGLDKVGRFDNFFELGGNSILVAKLLSAITKMHQVDISFSDVFKHASPVLLAQFIAKSSASNLPKLVRALPQSSLAAPPQQVRYFATYNVECTSSKRMTTIFGHWADTDILELAVKTLIEQQEIFRTGFFEREDRSLWMNIHEQVDFKSICWTSSALDERQIRAEMERRISEEEFNLQLPPLIKLLINRHEDGSCYALLGIFNGILDAYSGGLIEDEVNRIYDALEQRSSISKPEFQYQDFVQWQHRLTEHERYTEAKLFWNQQFPADYKPFYLPRPYPEKTGGSMLMFLLGEELSELAVEKAKVYESGFFTFLLANFFEVAKEWYQRDDVSVGLLYHGRDQEQLEDKIGYFVDLLCVKTETKGHSHFKTLVNLVNEKFFQSIDNRIYQYQDLAARYSQKLTYSRLPITGLHINNVIVPGEEKQLSADFVQQTLPLPYQPKFDLNIYVHESNRGIFIRMAYSNQVFSEHDAGRFAQWVKDTIKKNCSKGV
ncbi:amino acid adenylation domain-containing protein [Shewanella sp.]|uniref:amino acid adenylation domain-containing protein n=1 Tax=Shewanella sp. TaxID=50422 RepID=UPI004053DEB0